MGTVPNFPIGEWHTFYNLSEGREGGRVLDRGRGMENNVLDVGKREVGRVFGRDRSWNGVGERVERVRDEGEAGFCCQGIQG